MFLASIATARMNRLALDEETEKPSAAASLPTGDAVAAAAAVLRRVERSAKDWAATESDGGREVGLADPLWSSGESNRKSRKEEEEESLNERSEDDEE